MFFSKAGKSTVGLDIGANSIKLVKLDQTRNGYFVSGLGVRELPPEAIVSDEIRDREAVIFNVQALVESVDPRIKKVNVSISGHGIITDKFSLDRKTGTEAEQAILFETEQRAPFDIEDVTMDYQIVKSDEQTNKMDVIMVAARNEFINDFIGLLEECDLEPEVVDTDAFAALNAYTYNYEPDPERLTAVINVGQDVCNICYLVDGHLHSTRDVTAGVREIFNAIQKEFRLNMELSTKAMKGELSESIDQDMLKATIISAADDLVGGLEQAFSYFKSQAKVGKVDWIALGGGGALVPFLPEFMQSRLGAPIEIINPLRNIDYDPEAFQYLQPEKIAPLLTVPIGLAMRKAKKSK